MKQTFLWMLLLCLSAAVHAQQVRFVYIQADQGRPFYIRMGSKVISSAAAGYLILSELKDSTYQFNTGFPKIEEVWVLTVKIDRKDRGFVLKDFGEKGWGLFDLQTAEVLMGIRNERTKGANAFSAGGGSLSEDPFSVMLAAAVSDPSIRYKPTLLIKKTEVSKPANEPPTVPAAFASLNNSRDAVTVPLVAKEEEIKRSDTVVAKPVAAIDADTAQAIVEKEKARDRVTVVSGDTIAAANTSTKDSVVEISATPPVSSSGTLQEKDNSKGSQAMITKTMERNGVAGTELIYIDHSTAAKPDTIRIFIPVEKGKAEVAAAGRDSSKAAVKKQKEGALVSNPRCKQVASERDMDQLRRQLITGGAELQMVAIAKKAFRSKCYTTDQVRRLSFVFIKDLGKYDLFDAALPFIADPQNFSALEKQLNDSQYIRRFKNLVAATGH